MYCPKCGKEIPDNSKYCGVCGAKIEQIDSEKNVKNEENKIDINIKNKSILKHCLPIVGVLVIAIIIIIGVKNLFLKSSDKNAYVYLSNGTYELVTNLNKDQSFEIASSKSDDIGEYLLAFSPDGKYIYYYTKYDSTSGTGSLCRAEYGRLREDSKKNEQYIEIVATKVFLGFKIVDDGTVIYEKNNNALYCFDGKDSIQIAENIDYFWTDGMEKVVYETSDDFGNRIAYGVKLSDLENPIMLASDYTVFYTPDDFENMMYIKTEEDDTESMYVVGFEKDAEKIAKGARFLAEIEGRKYFLSENEKKVNLYDFVEDNYREADASISEPDKDNFSIPKYRYGQLYSEDNLEDYDEIYTTCSQKMYFYSRPIADKEQDNCKEFAMKYQQMENEDGYLLVTEEIKREIQEMAAEDGQGYDGEWHEFCFYREQIGTTLDYEAYNAAYEQWNEAQNRINLRQELQSEENDVSVKTLYCLDNGTLNKVDENVLSTEGLWNTFMYNTPEQITEKVKIEDIATIQDVEKLFEINKAAENIVMLLDGATCVMSSSAAEAYATATNDGYAMLGVTDKEVYLDEIDGTLSLEIKGTLSMANITDGVIGEFVMISDDANFMNVDKDTAYYTSNYYQNGDVSYCDLYSCISGTSTVLARDIIPYSANVYKDNTILAYTNSSETDQGYELSVIDPKGEATVIDDKVEKYIRTGESEVLYISDGNLYFYNGNESKFLDRNVEWIWSKDAMEIAYTLDHYSIPY